MATSIPAPVVATHLRQYLVAPEKLEFGEYVFAIKPTDDKTRQHFYQIIGALLNTSGGVIIIDLGVPPSSKDSDKWQNNLRDQLMKFISHDVYLGCVSLHEYGGLLYMVVHKSKVFVTTESFLFTRGAGAESVSVRHHSDISFILGQQVVQGPTEIFPRMGPYQYEQTSPMSESTNLEFKCYNTTTVSGLIKKLKDDRVEKTIFAMGNVPGGGEIVLGIKEPETQSSLKTTKGKQTSQKGARPKQSAQSQPQLTHLKGQMIIGTDEDDLITALEDLLKNASVNSQRLWGDPIVVPEKGKHWDCAFIPLGKPPYICQPRCQSCPHLLRRVLVCIRIFQCPGGLFTKRPEAYTLTDDGEIIEVPFEEWKTKHHLRKEATSTVITQPASSPKARTLRKTTIQPPMAKTTAEIVEYTDVFKHNMKISFKEHSSRSEVLDVEQEYSDDQKQKTDIFESTSPVHFTPSRDEIQKYLSLKSKNKFPQAIDDELSGQTGFGIADDNLFDCMEHNVNPASFTSLSAGQSTTLKPPSHILDLLVVTNITRIFLFVICSTLGPTNNWLIAYTMVLARLLKRKMSQRLGSAADHNAMNIICKIVSLDGSWQHSSSDYYRRWFKGFDSRNLTYVSTSLASILSQVNTHFRDAIHLGADMTLSQEQTETLLYIDRSRFNLIEGPPGCGKTLLARGICEKHGRKNAAFISACVPLNNRVGASRDVSVFHAVDSSHILSLLQGRLQKTNKKHIVIDDNHNYTYTDDIAEKICETVAVCGMTLYVFEDSKYQNYKDQATPQTLQRVMQSGQYGSWIRKTLTEIRRNSQVVGSFLKAQVSSLLAREEFNDFKCVNALKGDDIVIKHVSDLLIQNKENGLVKHIKHLVSNPLDNRSRRRTVSDIAVLVDDPEEDMALSDVRLYQLIFQEVWPDSKVQGAEVYPVKGVIIDTLTNFAGLESKVIVFVMPPSTDTAETVNNTKHRIAVASRGIERVDFIREENLDQTIARNMRCDLCPSSSLKPLPETKNEFTRELRLQEYIASMAVTADGELICCTYDSVVTYSMDGARSEFHAPLLNHLSPSVPNTLRLCSVAVHASTGDLVVGYDMETGMWTKAVYLAVFSRASNTWSPPQSLGEGLDPVVAWTKAGRVAVGVRGVLVLYDPTRHSEVWRKRTVGGEINEVGMWGELICCCHRRAAGISVYDQNGAFSHTLKLQAPGRQFDEPVSVCEGGGGQLLVLHQERVGSLWTEEVTVWSGTGEYVRDVVTGFPSSSKYDCMRLHGNTLCVSLPDEGRIVCYKLRPESSPSAATS